MILVDAGHGAKGDVGAVGIIQELSHNLQIREALKKYIGFVEVPNDLPLADRVKWINANSTGDDFLVSIHSNSGGGTGVEVWGYGGNTYSMNKANEFAQCLAEATGLKNRGGKSDLDSRFGRFGIVRDTDPAAWLCECGFVDSQTDVNVPVDLYAKGIAKFLEKQGFPLKTAPATLPCTPTIEYRDKIVEVIKEVPVEKIVYVDKPVEVIKEVPVEKIVEVTHQLTDEEKKYIALEYLKEFIKNLLNIFKRR